MDIKKVAVIAHDSGGAELISSWLKRFRGKYYLCIEGPAIKVFNKKIGRLKIYHLEEAINKSDWVLCGTSFKSDLERSAIQFSKTLNKKSVAFLDHWVNYLDRFIYKGLITLPNEIWVGDIKAKEIASSIFQNVPIKLKKNYYFDDIKLLTENLNNNRSNELNHILYVSEPISDWALFKYKDKNYFKYTEKTAMQYFLDNIHYLGIINPLITLRLHPAESKGKYDTFIKNSNIKFTISKNDNLIDDILASDIVVGCTTMALVIALIANKKVFCSIPKVKANHPLPYNKIRYIRDLIK